MDVPAYLKQDYACLDPMLLLQGEELYLFESEIGTIFWELLQMKRLFHINKLWIIESEFSSPIH